MHLSIPETLEQQCKDKKYTCYVIHVNGVRHCHVRFRQLHTLHQQICREIFMGQGHGKPCQGHPLPPFPPKKLFPLTQVQIEERRMALEKYLQWVAQDPRVVNSVSLSGFFLAAQQESLKVPTEDCQLEVFLMNELKATVQAKTNHQSEQVLESVCSHFGVPPELSSHFALFLVQKNHTGDITISRKLQEFEAPFLTLKSVATGHRLMLRKATWASCLDVPLLDQKPTLNLLYAQTVTEVEKGWVVATPETKKALARLQAQGEKKEYMEMASRLPQYGFLHFLPCYCDYPETNTPAQVSMGNRELIIKVRNKNGEVKEGLFKVTKMRCWRIMSVSTPNDFAEKDVEHNSTKFELSFEYLMSDGELKWVNVVSRQAILMSVCLQDMVVELLSMRKTQESQLENKVPETPEWSDYTFPCQDGGTFQVQVRNGVNSKRQYFSTAKLDSKSLTSRPYSTKKLSEKFSAFNFRDASKAAEEICIENEAFAHNEEEAFGEQT